MNGVTGAPTPTFQTLPLLGQFVIITSAGIAATLVASVIQKKYSGSSYYTLDALIDVESVADIADELPQDDEDFILEAWEIAGADVDYKGYGSILQFYNHTVKCQRCLIPDEVLALGRANCVGKSVLLTSILRNRFSAQDVYMAIGDHVSNAGITGHAWVQLRIRGDWYVIEATRPPPTDPWKTTDSLAEKYLVEALVNDNGLICYDPDVCSLDFSVSKRPCDCGY